jgi:hypothetical protein
MSFLTPDVVDDEATVSEAALAGVADQIPDWQPSDGGLVTPIAESIAIAIATAVTALQGTYEDTYLGFGLRVVQLARGVATLATCSSTWTVTANALTVIPAGTEVDGTLVDGTTSTFIVASDTTVAADATTVLGVVLEATETGEDQNGFTNPASTNLVGAVAVSIDAAAIDGDDAEDPDAYVNRVTARAQRLHFVPIVPDDWAAFMLDVDGVARCVVLNRYNPATAPDDAPGHITLVGVDIDGAALSDDVKTAVGTYFGSVDLPFNLVWHLADPEDVDVTVALTVKKAATADGTTVETDVQAAVAAALDPGTFDADSTAAGGWAVVRRTEVTVFDISAAADALDDVVAVTSVTINSGTTPVTLPAPVSLPVLSGTVTVTVE